MEVTVNADGSLVSENLGSINSTGDENFPFVR
jgi:hypothetical protein